MSAHGYVVDVVKDPETLKSLQPGWEDLFQRADRPYLSQSFEWIWCVWETITRPRGGHLHCILIREGSRPVLIWPLAILRYHRLWRAAKPLALATSYNDVLVESSPQARQLADLAWRTLCRSAGIDVILAERIRTDSLLHQVLLTEKAADTHAGLAVYVAWKDSEDWNAYHRRLSWRQTLDRQLRRLHERGHVAFELVQEPQLQHELIAWLLQHKLTRLAQQGVAPVWGNETEYLMGFLTEAARRVTRFGKLMVFALTLENQPIAAQTCTLEASRMTVMQIAYDPTWSKYGPGSLLFRHGLQWAFERRLPVDFGLGNFGYKKVFGNGEVEVLTRICTTNGWGHLSTLVKTLQRHLNAKRSGWRNSIRPKRVASP